MKTHLRIISVLGTLLLMSVATLYGSTLTVGSAGTYPTIGAAVTAASGGDVVSLLAGNTFTETVNISKEITLAGVDTTAKIHGSITISAGGAGSTIQSLVVYGSSGDGISASGISGLTLTDVVSRNNTGSGVQFTNCSNVTVSGGNYSDNSNQGFNATGGGSSYSLSGVTARFNGSTTPVLRGSGIDLKGVGTSTVTNCTASNNLFHGISIGDGASGITVDGGTYTLNGTAGDATTGAGINIAEQSGSSTSGINLYGAINSTNNTATGVFVFSGNSSNAVSSVSIGDGSHAITLSNNGSTQPPNGPGGAGVVVVGKATGVVINDVAFIKGSAPGAGLLVLKNTSGDSPSGTTVSNSSFTGYTSTYFAISLWDGSGAGYDGNGDKSTNTVDATSNNTFVGASTSAQIGAVIWDHIDDNTLGLVNVTVPAGLVVKAKVFLEGAYTGGGSMRTSLASGGFIPTSQTYSGSPFNYAVDDHVSGISVFTSNSIVDWVLVELRSTANGVAVDRRAALLKNDGTIRGVDGSAGVTFNTATGGSYFIVVKHRNHLAIMSSGAVSLPNGSEYDFTTAQSQAYGSSPMATLSSGYGMYGGDGDSDGSITGSDYNVFSPPLLAIASGYQAADFNLDGSVTGSDYNIFSPNLLAIRATRVP